MASKEKSMADLINNSFIKLIGTAFLIGMAWARMETRYDQTEDRIIKKIDEHIIKDGYDKQILESKIADLKAMVTDLEYKIDVAGIDEFVKPDEPTVERKKNRR